MDDQQQATSGKQDTPAQRQRVARLLLVLSPAMFLLCLVLARVQGAPLRDSLIIAFAGVAMCLVMAAHFKLRGAKSLQDVFWLNIIFNLFRR